MRTRLLRWFVSVAILSIVFFPKEMAYAQDEQVDRGLIEFGVRQLYGDRSSAKFNEYRDIPQGFFIPHVEVELHDLMDKSYFMSFQARDVSENDQTYLIGLGAYRKYRLDLLWDQTPHVFTTTAKTIFVETRPGVFTAPTVVRSFLQSQPSSAAVASLLAVLDSARLFDMSLRRDKGVGTLTLTPSSDWTVLFQYSREKQVGHRPFGTTTNGFGNPLELPEPIDYRTNQLKAGTEFGNEHGGIQASYSGSFFSNKVGTLVWDNPFRTIDTAAPTPSPGSSRGRLDLYPDNSAHNISLAGVVSIPRSTRLMASIVPGWMKQNDAFIPFTINTATPNVPALPAPSLNGSKHTLAMNYTLTSDAIPHVPLTLRYRSYDYNNETPSLRIAKYVSTDSSTLTPGVGIERQSLPYGYDRKTLGFDAAIEFLKSSSVAFLYEWERMAREHRDLEESTENTLGFRFDLSPQDWFLLRASYKHSDRDAEHYEANEESFPLGEGTALGQLHDLRKFDQAARIRHRVETLLQIAPADQFSFAASYGTTQDDYKESLYGLQKDINSNYTFEFTYNPAAALAIYAEYTREKFNYRQRSRQRTSTNDHPNNDWGSDRRDLVDTWAAGLDGNVSEKVIYDIFYSLSVAKNKISTRALGIRGAPGTPAFLPTTAQDYPDTSNRWHQLVTSIKLPINRRLTPKLEYRFEKYDRIDFQLVNVAQYATLDPSSATAIYLGAGADIPGYRAHIVSASLEIRF